MRIKNINHILDKIFYFLILFITIHFCVKCFSVAFTHTFSFDGAIIAQVAQNVADHFKFNTKYWNEEFYIPAIGATVIFPVALFFKLFGQTFTPGLLINAIYIILFFFAVIYYLKYCLKFHNYFILLWIIIFYGTGSIFEYGFGLYGEIPMITYFILGLIFLHKYFDDQRIDHLFLAGLFFGMGFLTKFIFLIIAPALLFVFLLNVFIKRKKKVFILIKHYLIFAGAFILPDFLFELYKLFNVGFKKFLFHWGWFIYAAGVQSGAAHYESDRIKDSPDLFAKVTRHINLLSDYTNINKFLIVFLLILGIYLFYLLLSGILKYPGKTKSDIKNILNYSTLFLTSVMLSYFIWWIFITPTDRAWHRRIIPGIILYEICFVIFLYAVYKIFIKTQKKNKKIFNIVIGLFALFFIILIGFVLIKSGNYKISFKDTKEKTEIMQAARYMTTFPADSEFFGFKWWQAPVISFASGRVFKDFFLSDEMKTTGEKHNKYLVLDRDAMKNQRLCYEKILSDFEYELLYVYDEVRIYKLTNRLRQREYIEECN